MLSRNIVRRAKTINKWCGTNNRAFIVASAGSQQSNTKTSFLFGTVAAGLALGLSVSYTYAEGSGKEKQKSWKVYSRKEVEAHNSLEKGVWVTYKDGVYDITNFIANHPGGQEKLMSVAGKDIASSWNIYQHHKTSALVKELAEEMKIGVLKSSDIIISEDLPNVAKFSNTPVYDCIIVGAGLSGLQCGSTLVNQHKVNQHNILVLEAQDYVGGRVKQIHEFVKGSKIEVGAEFLHGGGTELTKFAEEHGEPLREIYCWAHGDGGPLDDPADGGYGLYYIGKDKKQDTTKPDATGFQPLSYDKPYPDTPLDVKLNSKDRLLRMDEKDPDFVALNKALWELSHLNENDYDENLSLYDFLLSKKLNVNMLKMGNAGFANTLCTNSRQLSLKQSIKWSRIWHSDELPEEEDGDYTFVNSYSCLVDHLKKDLQIELNMPIDNVQYPTAENANKKDGSELIVLTAKNGTKYRAKTVVVTASPHVVQSKLITFSPELPSEVWDAFNSVKMHNVTKVFLKFKRPVWPKNLHGMIMVDDDFLLPEVWFREVSSEVAPGEEATAYAVGFTTAKYAERLTYMSQEEVFKRSLAQLEKVFSLLEPKHMNGDLKEKNIETVESLPKASEAFLGGMYWDWRPQHHPYIGGGYCSPLAGKPITYGDVLSKPCGPKMFFAGESTNSRPCATAHAALETGLRAADQVATALKK